MVSGQWCAIAQDRTSVLQCSGQVAITLRRREQVETECSRRGISRKKRVGREIPLESVNREISEGGAVETQDVSRLLGHHLDTYPSVLEICHADHPRLGSSLCLLALVGSEAMGDTDMPARGIDTRHLLAEKAPMGRGILPLVESDEVVNHLVEDSIFEHLLGQVYAGVDTKDEIGITPFAAEESALLAEADLSEEGLCIAQFDGNRRQLIVKILSVEIIELLSDIWNGGNQV